MRMLEKYQILKQNEKQLKTLFKLGVVNYSIINSMVIYEDFLECRTKGNIMNCYKELSKRHGLSISTIRNIVYDLSQQIASDS